MHKSKTGTLRKSNIHKQVVEYPDQSVNRASTSAVENIDIEVNLDQSIHKGITKVNEQTQESKIAVGRKQSLKPMEEIKLNLPKQDNSHADLPIQHEPSDGAKDVDDESMSEQEEKKSKESSGW